MRETDFDEMRHEECAYLFMILLNTFRNANPDSIANADNVGELEYAIRGIDELLSSMQARIDALELRFEASRERQGERISRLENAR